MKHRLLLFRNKWQVPFHLGSAFLPACLLVGAYAAPGTPYISCVVALIYLAGVLACVFLPDRARLAAGGASIAAILLAGLRILLTVKGPALILPPILYAWLLIETLPVFGKDSREELPPHVFVLGAVLHLAGQAALFIAGRNENSAVEAIRPGLSAAFVCFFLLTLLNLNRSNLIYVAAMEKTVPRHIYRFNRVLTVLLAAVTVFIGCLPAVVRFIRKIWMSAIGLLADLIAWFNSLFPVSEHIPETEAGDRGDPLFAYAESEPGLFAKILEILLYVIIAAVALFALWMIILYIRRFARWLWKRFQEYAAATGTGDYVDEISDTREEGRHGFSFTRARRPKDPLRGVNERRLAPGPRVRFYYLRLLVRHSEWKSSRTARENLPEAAAVIYERARYSTGDITETDARSFLELTGEHK